MTVSAFPNMQGRRARPANVRDVTIRDFSGGLKKTTSDANLAPKFSTQLKNLFVNDDGLIMSRFGYKEFTTCSATIVELTYFEEVFVVFLSDGTIETVDADGNATAIWNTAIAAALPGAPSGWSATNHIDFTEFNGELLVVNGRDKPLTISASHVVTYLQDLATGSNFYTPISRHVATVGTYVVMDDLTNRQNIHISNAGTSGTWMGDPDPNDGTNISLGAYVGQGSTTIKGLRSFRNKLLVFFEEVFLVVTLGTYDIDGNHVPDVVDTIVNRGLINHRCIFGSDKNLVFLTTNGMFAAKQEVFTEKFDTRPLSDAIHKDLVSLLATSSDYYSGCHLIADENERLLFVLIQTGASAWTTYAMKYDTDFTKIKWSTMDGLNFAAAGRSERKRVFFTSGNTIHQYGNSAFDGEDYRADALTDVDTTGQTITIEWEMPWTDLGSRATKKRCSYVMPDVEGSATFSFSIFTDGIYADTEGNLLPQATMTFQGGSLEVYGDGGYGGGRKVNIPLLQGFPVEFKRMKLRITGSIFSSFLMSAITLILLGGRYKR